MMAMTTSSSISVKTHDVFAWMPAFLAMRTTVMFIMSITLASLEPAR